MDRWMDMRVDRWTDRCRDGCQTDRWMDGQVDGWMWM